MAFYLAASFRFQMESSGALWRSIFSAPYFEAGREGFDVAIVLIEVGLKRAEVLVGVAPGSGEVAVWLEKKQRDAVGLDGRDRCGDVFGPVVFIGDGRGDGGGGL